MMLLLLLLLFLLLVVLYVVFEVYVCMSTADATISRSLSLSLARSLSLFLFLQANSFGANYSGEPFMESFRDNKWLSRSLIVAWITAAVCASDIFPPLNDLLQLVPLPSHEFRLQIIGLYALDTFLIFGSEHFVRKWYGSESSKLQQTSKL